MNLQRFRSETARVVIVVVLWGLTMASISSAGLFREAFLGPIELGLMLMVSFTAGALVSDIGKTIIGYFAAATLGTATIYLVAISPSLIGAVGAADGALLQELWVSILLRAFFPFPFIGFLAASAVGAAVGETYL